MNDLSSRNANKMHRNKAHPVTNSHAISHTTASLTCILTGKIKVSTHNARGVLTLMPQSLTDAASSQSLQGKDG